eukprot:TRINITY_DN1147_c0_g2_i1.p1 TRINITY_DN1147_c0_g2~~TRINITY_DN1147_c0_g2_i1.p1  ORF type:complete len:833 (-),score=244.96 TRINITY_DN1147_c0_g2_i1:300-2798(-)
MEMSQLVINDVISDDLSIPSPELTPFEDSFAKNEAFVFENSLPDHQKSIFSKLATFAENSKVSERKNVPQGKKSLNPVDNETISVRRSVDHWNLKFNDQDDIFSNIDLSDTDDLDISGEIFKDNQSIANKYANHSDVMSVFTDHPIRNTDSSQRYNNVPSSTSTASYVQSRNNENGSTTNNHDNNKLFTFTQREQLKQIEKEIELEKGSKYSKEGCGSVISSANPTAYIEEEENEDDDSHEFENGIVGRVEKQFSDPKKFLEGQQHEEHEEHNYHHRKQHSVRDRLFNQQLYEPSTKQQQLESEKKTNPKISNAPKLSLLSTNTDSTVPNIPIHKTITKDLKDLTRKAPPATYGQVHQNQQQRLKQQQQLRQQQQQRQKTLLKTGGIPRHNGPGSVRSAMAYRGGGSTYKKRTPLATPMSHRSAPVVPRNTKKQPSKPQEPKPRWGQGEEDLKRISERKALLERQKAFGRKLMKKRATHTKKIKAQKDEEYQQQQQQQQQKPPPQKQSGPVIIKSPPSSPQRAVAQEHSSSSSTQEQEQQQEEITAATIGNNISQAHLENAGIDKNDNSMKLRDQAQRSIGYSSRHAKQKKQHNSQDKISTTAHSRYSHINSSNTSTVRPPLPPKPHQHNNQPQPTPEPKISVSIKSNEHSSKSEPVWSEGGRANDTMDKETIAIATPDRKRFSSPISQRTTEQISINNMMSPPSPKRVASPPFLPPEPNTSILYSDKLMIREMSLPADSQFAEEEKRLMMSIDRLDLELDDLLVKAPEIAVTESIAFHRNELLNIKNKGIKGTRNSDISNISRPIGPVRVGGRMVPAGKSRRTAGLTNRKQ